MSFPVHSSYRHSAVAWCGTLPSHWNTRRLKSLFRLVRRPPQDGDKIITAFRDGQVTLRERRRVEGFTNALQEIGYQRIHTGDLVIHAMDGFAGAIGVSDAEGKSTPVYSVCVPGHEADSQYFARLLRHMALSGFVNALAKGVRERSTEFRWSDAGVLELPCPPVAEQRAIVAFLDRETAKIDALVDEQLRLIELLKQKRQAVISNAVTKGLDPAVPFKESGVKWMGRVPAHWEVRRIGSVSTKITNGYVGPTRDILVDDGVRYLQSLHIKRNKIIFRTPYFVRQDWSEAHAKSILDLGDVLIVQTGDIGQVAVVSQEHVGCNCHALIIVSPVRGQLDGQWLSWVLNSEYGLHSLLSIQTGALHPHLNCGNVKDLRVPMPPLDEQIRIVAHVEAQVDNFTAVTKQAEALVVLLKERRSALISAAVTGKIDVRQGKLDR